MTILAWIVRLFMRCLFPGWDVAPTLDEVRDRWYGRAA